MAVADNLAAASVKYAPTAAIAGVLDRMTQTFDPFILCAILIGLVAGATWRAGDARKKGETWDEIRDDLLISLMTGLANFIIAVIVSAVSGGGPIAALGLAMVIGAKGTDAMSWFADRFMGRGKAE
jgi:hypothetical protein